MRNTMYLKSILVILFLGLITISCSSCKVDKEENGSENLEKVNDLKYKAMKNAKLPPGSVKVRSLINSITIDNNNLMNIVIDGVLGYGTAAPVIGKGENLTFKVSDDQKEKILKNTKNIVLILKNKPSGRGEETTDNWQLISIEE